MAKVARRAGVEPNASRLTAFNVISSNLAGRQANRESTRRIDRPEESFLALDTAR